MKKDYTAEAASLINSGISVGPLRTDGTKLPAIKWKEFQTRLMSFNEVQHYFKDCGGVFAITGKISDLFLFDFDLKYDYNDEDTYERFIAGVPEELKAKFSINKTRSGGMHIWIRTKYSDKSRKVTRRELTLSEFATKVTNSMLKGANEKTAMKLSLTAPFECTLETRSEGSYGVIAHPSYSNIQKYNGHYTTEAEMEFLLSLGYSLDCGFIRREHVFIGEEDTYKEIARFNEDCGVDGMITMIEKSGLYESIGVDHNGNHQMRRAGSSSSHSGYVYQDSGVFKIFGTNLFDTNKDTITPFEMYRILNNTTVEGAVKKIIEKREEKSIL